MCGITGFWSRAELVPDAARSLLSSMATRLAHRGPDGEGSWFSGDGAVGLAHRRLSIIDLNPTGAQPMRSARGRYTIVFNGEVFNFGELRAELDRGGEGPAWRGTSDTEVMLAAIEAWGLERALERFVGMFAFALWDAEERTLRLVRDRLGIKPLYWSQTPQGLCFGSELKALMPFPGVSRTVDRRVLAGYFERYVSPGRRAIFEGVEKLQPGHVLTFRAPDAPPRVHRFWSAAETARRGVATPFGGSDDEAISALDAQLRTAIGLRMIADVPLGAFLSGGIDSSTVVAVMQALSPRPVHTFSIENADAAFDESGASRAVAAHLGTHHTPLRVSAADALELIPRLPTVYDEPFADSSQIPTFLVSQLARRHVTVALSGDGGDELFAGYNRHVYGPRLWKALRRAPAALRRSAASALEQVRPEWIDRAAQLPGMPGIRLPGLKLHKLAGVLALDSPDAMHDRLARHWGRDDALVLGDPAPWPDEFEEPGFDDVLARMQLKDLVSYLPDDILTKVDRASMAVSLEARVPLLDHRLLAFAWTLPERLKVRGTTGKWILRQVLARYLPLEKVTQSKMGFGVPIGDWLKGPLRSWAEALLERSRLEREGFLSASVVRTRWDEFLAGKKPWEHHLWDVLMFQAWREAWG